MSKRAVVLGLALGLLGPGVAEAQDWRTVTSYRQRGDEGRIDVHVRYGAGRLLIAPAAAGGELYRLGMRYDSDLFTPISEYAGNRLEVGVEGTGQSIRLRNREAGELDLRLSPDVPMDLDLDFGAVEADIDLGGLSLTRLDIETGASETRVTFDAPNPVSCDELKISMGAASLDVTGLGNAGCALVKVDGGVGDMTLDFSGEWRRGMDAEINMALGSLTLIVPSDVGVRVDRDTFLTGFDGARFEKRDGVLYSSNWESARHRLTVDLAGAFGSINVRWRD